MSALECVKSTILLLQLSKLALVLKIELTASISKGQLNSEWIYEVIVSPKMPTKNLKDLMYPTLYVINFQGTFWSGFWEKWWFHEFILNFLYGPFITHETRWHFKSCFLVLVVNLFTWRDFLCIWSSRFWQKYCPKKSIDPILTAIELQLKRLRNQDSILQNWNGFEIWNGRFETP